MKNTSVSSSGKGFARWIEDFITGLAVKEAATTPDVQDEKEEVLAEINLNDLDKVVWKDESFGVHFDDKGASLINEFGNVVRTIPNCKSIDEVDKQLNGSEIVVSSVEDNSDDNDLDEELAKIADVLDDENEVDEDEVKVAELDGEDEENEDDPVITAIASGFEELEATIASLTQRLAVVEQQYARNPQFTPDSASDQIAQEEIKHFTESADQSAQEVNREHSTDITSPAGRVELSQHPQTSEVQEIVTQDTTPTGTTVDPNEVQMNTEAPKAEEKITEVPKTEEKSEVKEVPVKEKEEETEVPEDETPEKEEVPAEEKKETTAEVVSEDLDDEEPAEEPAVEKLAGVAEKIFQKGVCPETGEELIKSKTVGSFLGVYSNAGTEYAVDLNTGAIYKYIK